MQPKNLAAALQVSLHENPAKPAVFWGDTTYTYQQLWRQCEWVALQLQAQGLQPGDRVGIWLKNCPQFVPALFGIFLAGGVAVPINNFLKPYELAYILEDSESRILITEAASGQLLDQVRNSLPHLSLLQVEQFQETGGTERSRLKPVERATADLAVIIYTSGTTGRPKGAMLSHGNLLSNVESCRQVLAAVREDRFALLLPMFHSFMLTVCVLLPLSVGSSIVLVKSLHPPKNILLEIMQRQATLLPAIPQLFRALAGAPLPPQLPLRLCVSGAAPLPVEVLHEFNRKVPVPLLEGYGLSEASPVVTMNPLDGPCKAGSIGKALPGVEVTIQDGQGRQLPPHEIGELCVRGGNVMQGYWKKEKETSETLKDGWLRTGDIGYSVDEGYFYITDRKKDMLLVNGINVYPREIEEILYQFPGVKEAAVVGKPDARKGEAPVAFVALDEGVAFDDKAMLQHVRAKLADYKIPKRIIQLPALPRNATGKILKTELRTLPLDQPTA